MRICLEEVNELEQDNIEVVGDFNVDLLNNSRMTRDLLELFGDFGLKPLFIQPSRV
ncbi:hypothetical protein HHI36_016727, partial [Cryptolaemus montrouzieri]